MKNFLFKIMKRIDQYQYVCAITKISLHIKYENSCLHLHIVSILKTDNDFILFENKQWIKLRAR